MHHEEAPSITVVLILFYVFAAAFALLCLAMGHPPMKRRPGLSFRGRLTLMVLKALVWPTWAWYYLGRYGAIYSYRGIKHALMGIWELATYSGREALPKKRKSGDNLPEAKVKKL